MPSGRRIRIGDDSMANQSVEKRCTIPLPPCLIHNCLNCRSERPCPPLLVVAMRYAQEMAGREVDV